MMPRLTIAHVVQRYLPAELTGSETYVRYVSEELVRKGHDVTVLTSNAYDGKALRDPIHGKFIHKKREEINDVNVLRFKINHLFSFYPIAQILRDKQILYRPQKAQIQFPPILNFKPIKHLLFALHIGPFTPAMYFHIVRSTYDIIHVTPFPLTHVLLAATAARKAKIPLICTPFFHFENPLYYNIYFRTILTQANAIFTPTGIEKRKIAELGINSDKIHVIPVGIEPSEWKKVSGARFKKKYGLENVFVVLFVGQKTYDKGAIHVLQAIDIVQRHRKDVMLLAVGGPTPEWQAEKRRLKGLKIIDLDDWKSRDKSTGFSGQDKYDAFDACDVLVMPSRAETFGIVYLEAWMCRKPVIGAKAGAIPEVIRNGTDGYVVEFGDVEDLAQKILYLLKKQSLRETLGNKGRERVLAHYTWPQIVERIEDVYESIVL